jgi:hypothetical protein
MVPGSPADEQPQGGRRQRDVGQPAFARNTDARSMIGTILSGDPTPHMASLLITERPTDVWPLAAVMNSLVLDYLARMRLSGTHLDWHVIADLPFTSLPRRQTSRVGNSQNRDRSQEETKEHGPNGFTHAILSATTRLTAERSGILQTTILQF